MSSKLQSLAFPSFQQPDIPLLNMLGFFFLNRDWTDLNRCSESAWTLSLTPNKDEFKRPSWVMSTMQAVKRVGQSTKLQGGCVHANWGKRAPPCGGFSTQQPSDLAWAFSFPFSPLSGEAAWRQSYSHTSAPNCTRAAVKLSICDVIFMSPDRDV